MRIRSLILSLIYGCLCLPLASYSPPAFGHAHGWLDQSAQVVGQGRFSVFLFDIYDAELLSPDGRYNGLAPYALRLTYLRDIESDDIVEASLDEMRRQGEADVTALKRWKIWMTTYFPDIQKGDEAVMIALADGGMILMHNGVVRGQIDEVKFVTAFMGIWLSENALKPALSRTLRGLRKN